ncbi:alpha/beta hydrolase [Tardiphaga sp. P9-11]|uniref:alpha/beta fold hydrolase n=1 Tax=Tardiphaga sp. P9-11 TaxID=2024614 RepID=UPI0011F31D3A|nr:alpha/beta hydrolase [Tardiphaga sp. P9-11]KAA0076850.1 alpha/beta hydrolase [Tardiphaga sp. P9-11]
MADLYVLVHGAWHTGKEMDAVAGHLRASGHIVHCPTVAGNNANDDRSSVGLTQAIASIADYIEKEDLWDIRLVGHSYGGMVISGVADRMAERIKRLVYVNAFVPLDGQSLNDMVPPHYLGLFDSIAAANNNAVMLPFEIWREAFINDADFGLAKSAYEQLNPHPYKTFTDTIALSRPLAELAVGKSYVNCQQDIALPHSLPWHPRLSERLGLFRLVECPGSHEMFFSNPARLAEAIIQAGRD